MSRMTFGRATRVVAVPAIAALAALAATAAPAGAATAATANQAITGVPASQLVATFPSDYAFASLSPGNTATSSEQIINVKSNGAWGIKIASDSATGVMRRHNDSAYVAGSLASALQWAKSREGTPIGSPSYASLSSTQALVSSTLGPTTNAGTDVGVTFQQPVSYGDNASIGTDSYRVVVTYVAQQGF